MLWEGESYRVIVKLVWRLILAPSWSEAKDLLRRLNVSRADGLSSAAREIPRPAGENAGNFGMANRKDTAPGYRDVV